MNSMNQVALGESHMCKIRNGGEVWCQGDNSCGQLGNGSTNSSPIMVRAGTITDAVSVWAGRDNSFAVTAAGILYAWGSNCHRMLGIGTSVDQSSPVPVPGVSGVKKVAAENSYKHTIILLDDGTIRVAGETDYTGTRNGSPSTFGVPKIIDDGVVFSGVKDIANGFSSSYLINGDGTVWGVGERRCNALADGIEYGATAAWQRIGNRSDAERLWGRYRGGAYETAGGEYYGWGYDGHGALGLGNTIHYSSDGRYHTALPHYADARQLAFGGFHTIMLKNDGTVWANGCNEHGQLGDWSTRDRYSPVQVSGISGDVIGIVAGYFNSSAITTRGQYFWGSEKYERVGAQQ